MKNNLEKILQQKEIKKADFAKALDVTPNTIQNWCKAKSMNTLTMYHIAKHLGVNVSDIFEIQ